MSTLIGKYRSLSNPFFFNSSSRFFTALTRSRKCRIAHYQPGTRDISLCAGASQPCHGMSSLSVSFFECVTVVLNIHGRFGAFLYSDVSSVWWQSWHCNISGCRTGRRSFSRVVFKPLTASCFLLKLEEIFYIVFVLLNILIIRPKWPVSIVTLCDLLFAIIHFQREITVVGCSIDNVICDTLSFFVNFFGMSGLFLRILLTSVVWSAYSKLNACKEIISNYVSFWSKPVFCQWLHHASTLIDL